MNILVTGGAGYIGSHTCISLIEAGYTPIIIDNLSNSKMMVLDRIEQIAGVRPKFYLGDVQDRAALDNVFAENEISAVIHFAALKAVGESTQIPLKYYRNNITGTLTLFEAMEAANVKNFVFSSSATVYGDPEVVPITEDSPRSATNPYGQTKLMMEQIAEDVNKADKSWSMTLLRYFNPVGAHPSGLIGEDPQGIPNNLMPFVAQVAVGRREKLSVFGNDYPTPDGTGVRDYIHVMDLAEGHVKALQHCSDKHGTHIYNLGTGQGYSVLDMVKAFSQASDKAIPYEIAARRPGDIAECWAAPDKAERELGWKCSRTLNDMTSDTWRWQSMNPNGYEE